MNNLIYLMSLEIEYDHCLIVETFEFIEELKIKIKGIVLSKCELNLKSL